MIRLVLALMLIAVPLRAQEITQGMMPEAPMAWGSSTANVTIATLAVGKVTASVAVPGTRVGDLVFVLPAATAGLSVGTVLSNVGHVTADGTVQVTFNTPGLVALSLGTVALRFRWLRFAN